MADEPVRGKPRWNNPEDDAGFAAAFIKGCQEAQPVAPLSGEEKELLQLLLAKAAEAGDANLVRRLEWYATNPLGFREMLATMPPAAGETAKSTSAYHDAAGDLYIIVTGVKGTGGLTYGVLVDPQAGTVGEETPVESIARWMPYSDFKPFTGALPAAVKMLIDRAPEPPPLRD